MIEIVGEPRKATAEEIKELRENAVKQERIDWREAMLRTFLAGH